MKLFRKRLYVRHLLAAFAVAALLAPVAMTGQAPGKHPAYLHALSDLRFARGYLSELGANDTVDNDSVQAIKEIDAAINELKKASIDDGKNLHDHPTIDAHLERTGRFHRALELLDSALADINKEEDDPAAVGLRARIVAHIDAAHHSVRNAIAASPKK